MKELESAILFRHSLIYNPCLLISKEHLRWHIHPHQSNVSYNDKYYWRTLFFSSKGCISIFDLNFSSLIKDVLIFVRYTYLGSCKWVISRSIRNNCNPSIYCSVRRFNFEIHDALILFLFQWCLKFRILLIITSVEWFKQKI